MLDTYAMVVWCLTVFMFLIIILSNNWTNKKVDYTNVFTQTELKEEMFIRFIASCSWDSSCMILFGFKESDSFTLLSSASL